MIGGIGKRAGAQPRTIAKSPLLPVILMLAAILMLPVILSEAKNLTLSAETLRSAQGDNLLELAIVLARNPLFRAPGMAGILEAVG